MEALALASTFATLIGFSMQLYGNCKFYIDAARGDCPNDLKLILFETSSLEATLKVVQDILSVSDNRRADEERLQRQIGKPIQDCKSCIEQLLKLAKIILNASAWGTGGKKGTCDTLLKHLKTHKATLSLGLTTELSHEVKQIGADVAEVKTTVNTMQAKLDQAERGEVFKWLEKVNPSTNHNHAGETRERETGQWLTRSDEWNRLIGGGPRSRFLWLHGTPGAGKTVLAYNMVEQVRSMTKADKKQGLAYYYCYHGRNRDETVPFLTWILCRLCRASEYIPVILTDLFRSGVAERLPVKARGMFRYAACQLEILAECGSIAEVEKELNQLPATLDETYERILRNIDPKNREYAVRALALVLGSMDEAGPILAQTLVTGVVGLGTKSFCNIDTLSRYCICLIEVRRDHTVDVAHYTVREFLQSSRIQQKLPFFALPKEKVDEIFSNTVMSAAAQVTTRLTNIRNMPEDRNGEPVDFRAYALRRTRMAMFWHKSAVVGTPQNKDLMMKLLNPYEPTFRGLQLAGTDGPSDDGNEVMFEWLPKFNDKADAMEKAAAHLTMLVSSEKPDFVKKFLGTKSDQQKSALFSTEMSVLFPADWKVYRKRGTYDPRPISVTVMGFYKEGLKRGYDTKTEIKMLSTVFGITEQTKTESMPAGQPSAQRASNSRPATPLNSKSTPSPPHRTPAPTNSSRDASSTTSSSNSSRPNLRPNTPSNKIPPAQGRGQSQVPSQPPHGQGLGRGQGQGPGQGHGMKQQQQAPGPTPHPQRSSSTAVKASGRPAPNNGMPAVSNSNSGSRTVPPSTQGVGNGGPGTSNDARG
ncbi:hypothetical protein C8A00DRAFT_36938 [Chaetomidium leptoderma]|uniref:Nephrocystin 3-like N-terminal domain-containing protein n=1 Tax=Chaetomidium leptoderma TaxID=669021 RepID=A0AAN6ZTM0_9PEZI|nr:hypothetical protein C8A00DRAFT_36938 [Chaetomidium leptoderma]